MLWCIAAGISLINCGVAIQNKKDKVAIAHGTAAALFAVAGILQIMGR